MRTRYLLLAGPLAACIFGLGVFILPAMLPSYSQINQTISAIGAAGSPARVPFAIMLCVVAGCLLVFGAALRHVSVRAGLSPMVGYMTAWMALSSAGVALFAYPDPLHEYFYASEVIGLQAPVALAITWRRHPGAGAVVRLSWLIFALVWIAIVVNVTMIHRSGDRWAYQGLYFGLAQRSVFLLWSLWATAAGVMLFHILRGDRVCQEQPGPDRDTLRSKDSGSG